MSISELKVALQVEVDVVKSSGQDLVDAILRNKENGHE